jgi:hypothetical protein
LERIKEVWEAVGSEILRGKKSWEKALGVGGAFWQEERQSSLRGRNGLGKARKEKAFYGGEAQ